MLRLAQIPVAFESATAHAVVRISAAAIAVGRMPKPKPKPSSIVAEVQPVALVTAIELMPTVGAGTIVPQYITDTIATLAIDEVASFDPGIVLLDAASSLMLASGKDFPLRLVVSLTFDHLWKHLEILVLVAKVVALSTFQGTDFLCLSDQHTGRTLFVKMRNCFRLIW